MMMIGQKLKRLNVMNAAHVIALKLIRCDLELLILTYHVSSHPCS